ncbi:vWA-MoxR associated conflict system protein [Streptomyces yaizuensis]|uniref:Caspase family protein n=1 Tax=Streptomyces yaizuensis TaxID=2989713 RepID=A0ABQ5NZS8_9ACTN|nr:hypothetical protein [Streptomyces sp. YSPA8]GLF95853.1 caspase family protein [Streptomyces sp. YSPA8]
MRHVLVVASQCAAEEELPGLAEVADGVFGALTDPRVGGCVESPVPGAARMRAGAADRREVDGAVREAILRAGAAGAVLVLVFIGHGQAPDDAATLHFLARDSRPGEMAGAVDVGALLAAAADQPGVDGVIALLDTCQAAAGAPGGPALTGGYAQGLKRVAVLMAATARRPAYDLDFSRELTALLRRGVPDAGPLLSPRTVKAGLGERLLRQDTTYLEYDGDPGAPATGLWLARNTRHSVSTTGALGPLGAAELHDALAEWTQADPGTAWTPDALDRLARSAAASLDPAALRVRETAEALLAAVATGRFLTDWATGLSTPHLRTAIVTVNRMAAAPGTPPLAPPAAVGGSELLRHLLEFAVLRTTPALLSGGPGASGGPGGALARCVVAVAGACGLDPGDPAVLGWARGADAVIALNDAREAYAGLREDHVPRLVISLHAAPVDWPESLAGFLRVGDRARHQREFACVPTRSGVEERLPEIVEWAESLLPAGEPLRHVDIAAPSAVLAEWHPEHVPTGLYELGADRTVTLRWARRLGVPRRLRGINGEARRRLALLDAGPTGGEAPVDWLDPVTAQDTTALKGLLRMRRFQRAIGVDHRPAPPRLAELLETLLPYTPVLFWPGAGEGRAGDAHRDCLGLLWPRLPAGFGEAYQRRRLADAGVPAPHLPPAEQRLLDALAELRTVWHDRDWLDFCLWYEGAAPPPEPASPEPASPEPPPTGPTPPEPTPTSTPEDPT